MPAEYFDSYTGSGDWITINLDSESSYGRAIAEIPCYDERLNSTSLSEILTIDNIPFEYGSTRFVTTRANGDIYNENLGDGVYRLVISHQLTSDVSISNGIFYNIIPFIIIFAVAILGIFILKKNSIK